MLCGPLCFCAITNWGLRFMPLWASMCTITLWINSDHRLLGGSGMCAAADCHIFTSFVLCAASSSATVWQVHQWAQAVVQVRY